MYRTITLAGLVWAIVVVAPWSLQAADLRVQSGPYATAPADCGPCGCLSVEFVRHRSVEETYGISFDPRNYDMTEPHYYWGPMRRYPRYFVDGVAVPCSATQ